jgi:hypothetical protein
MMMPPDYAERCASIVRPLLPLRGSASRHPPSPPAPGEAFFLGAYRAHSSRGPPLPGKMAMRSPALLIHKASLSRVSVRFCQARGVPEGVPETVEAMGRPWRGLLVKDDFG